MPNMGDFSQPIDDTVAEAPDQEEQKSPYEDMQEISERIDKVLSSDRFSRALFERDWFRNILFIAGAQWIIYSSGRWRQRELPIWFPRAQTNKFGEKHNDLVTQLISGGRVPVTYTPATDDKSDQATAEIAERVREVIYTEAEIDDQEFDIASWLIATGNCFGIPHYDMSDEYGMKFVSYQRCLTCGSIAKPEELAESDGSCPTCLEEGIQSTDFEDAMTPENEPLGEEYPIGAIQMDVCSPFEIRLDQRVKDIRKLHRFVRQHRYEVEWCKEKWPEFADFVKPDGGADDPGQFYLDVISNITSSFGMGSGFLGGGTSSKNPRLTAFEIFELPSKKYPQGLHAVRLGRDPQAVVLAEPLPTQYGAGVKQNQKFLPLIHWGVSRVPGRFWYKTPLDDLVPLQLFRNTTEANTRLSIQRMGNAIWLLPKGSGVEIITGEPGLQMPYNPVSVGGTQFAKPERIPAELNNLAALIMMLKVIDDAMERLAGTFFLQGGTAPPGVTAASALAYLGEKGQQSLSALRSNWAKGWRRFDMMTLEIARQNWDEDRLRVIAGKNRKWQVQKFSKSDLQGAVNVVIDYNGLAPKSNATERATIAQLIQLGIVNPQDAEMQLEVLKAFGSMKLKGSMNVDVEDAAKEQDAFMTDPTFIPEIRPFVDNSTVHLAEHTLLAKTDEFRELPPDRQQVWYEHIKNTVLDIVTRRVMLTQAGLDPDVPALAEVPSADATIAAQAAAAQQNGGVPSGAEGPDERLNAAGEPNQPEAPAQGEMTPDIAALMQQPGEIPAQIKPEGSPRTINIPGQ